MNQMKVNPDKCHLMTSKNEDIVVTLENSPIKNNKCEKLLGVKIDYILIFNSFIDVICKKAGQEINALYRIVPCINIEKHRTLLNTFFISEFSYCHLIWICHSCAKNNKLNRLHKRYLRIIYKDKISIGKG